MGINLKFLKEKVKGSDHDVKYSCIACILSRTFPSILLTSNCMALLYFSVIENFGRACYFPIALQIMPLPIALWPVLIVHT